MNQKEVWNKIAPEWHDYKIKPAQKTIEFLKKQKGKILDLGSGSGRNLLKTKNIEMYLLDFSKNMIKLAEKKAEKNKIKAKFFVSNMKRLPFEDNFFDAGICISSLHCIKGEKNREKAIKELLRVLKPKAKALIGVWNKNSKRFKNSPKEKKINWTTKGKRYYYLYDEKEVQNLFKKIGFKIISTQNSEMMINFIVKK